MNSQNDDRRRSVDGLIERIHEMELSIRELEGKVDMLATAIKEFVTNSRFTPVQVLVYGLVSLIMTSVFAAIIAKVIVK